MKKYIFFSTLFILLFSACSSKEVFKPKVLSEDWKKYSSAYSDIVDVASNVALLEDRSVVSTSEHIKVKIPKNHRIIVHSKDWLISASIDGNTTLTSVHDKTLQEHIHLKKTIASANIEGDILAILFADNEMALYDITTKTALFKEQGSGTSVVDNRLTPPYFMKGLVLFATLDGKISIVNIKEKKRLRTVIVSSEDNFNNIIYANILDNRIIAATQYKLLSMSKKELRAKYEIRDVIQGEKQIYLTTKQGELFALTPDLQVDSKVKFPFAHFLGMISLDDKIYLLEKQGYLIVVDKKSFDYTIHEVDIEDGFVFVGEKLFYVNDEKILLQ